MRRYLLLFISIFICLATDLSLAQTRQLKFDKITGANGVSVGTINAITQDKYGFIWFSDETNQCITRYDGSSMKRYKYDPADSNSLGGYYPECLFADSTGVLWIGFYGQGLDRFDPLTETFTHYRHSPNDPESLSHDFVSAVRIDHLGNIWVGTNGGLDLLNQETGKFSHFQHSENDPTSLSDNEVRAIYEDREGVLWIGSGTLNNIGGLNKFDRSKGNFTRYLHDPSDAESLIDNSVRSIFEDSKGNFWVGTAGDGLHTMNRKSGKFTRHRYDPKQPEKLSRPPIIEGFDIITFIAEDVDQNIWIGSNSNGINRYDPETKKIKHFGNNTDESGTFIENTSWCIYVAQDGLIWLSTQPGLYRIDPFYIPIPRFNKKLDIFFQETSTLSWIGTDNGLLREDLSNGTATRFIHSDSQPNSISNNVITQILKDRKGMLWVGTESGLNRYDPTTGIFTRYIHDPNDSTSLGSNYVTAIYEDNDSVKWIGTATGGLQMLDPNTEKFINYKSNDSNDITQVGVQMILEDDPNNLLINMGTVLLKLNRHTGNFTRYLSGLRFHSLYKDAEGINWVATGQGLYRYDKNTNNFISVINDNIFSIIGDEHDNLWVSGSNGFFKINKARNHIIQYAKENKVNEGLFFRNVGKAYKKLDGQIILGELSGYYAFYPERLITHSDSSQVYITDFLIHGKRIKPDSDEALRQSLYVASEINLEHNQNIISLTISEMDFGNTINDILYYMLENYDDEWRSATPGEKINYFKVPHGNYTFRIKATNSRSGTLSEKSLLINISPPWWLTWWAYTGYFIVFAGIIIIVDQVQRKRIIEKERALAKEKELEQAREIEKAYKELKSTQSQLIQSEKMASLGELTAGIAHEIQNPLNFVNNFSEVNKELIDEMQQELKNGNNDEAVIISNSIKDNQEKINHHGKRADGIVKGMLQHSRSSNGVKEPTDINALCDEYLRLSYHGLRAKDKSFNAKFETDFDSTLPKLNIVPQDIGRVVLNLISNAFYAVNERLRQARLPDGQAQPDSHYEPTVSVSTRREGNKVLISVKDNGNGIPDSIKEKIFQPFFTTKPTGQGTGLGLSLSYDIVKAHGGELKVETEIGKGSVFALIIPDS